MKEIEDYLHLYLGAKIRHRYVDFAPDEWSIWYKLSTHGLNLICNDASIEKIEIKLRKLSDMTDEETEELQKINQPGTVGYLATNKIIYYAFEVQYLLSKNFDLFGLIPAGLAIDSKLMGDH